MKTKIHFLLPLAGLLILLTSCSEEKEPIRQQMVTQSTLNNVRLADGIPLRIDLSTRWVIENQELFFGQFRTAGEYDSLILIPRQKELANHVSIQYHYVDSVFTSQRKDFIYQLKEYLVIQLNEEGIKVNDVIISNIEFPVSYTSAKEQLALQDQELKRIKKQSIIDQENAEANRQQAIAQGVVNVEQAKLNAELEKINAETEKSRRASMLARAETEKQVAEKQAHAEARRQVLLAEAEAQKQELYAQKELVKKTKLKDLEIQRQKELDLLAVEKEKLNEKQKFENDMRMAELCAKNPAYANYLINKELASKVQIAVLPSGQEATVFSGLLNTQMSNK